MPGGVALKLEITIPQQRYVGADRAEVQMPFPYGTELTSLLGRVLRRCSRPLIGGTGSTERMLKIFLCPFSKSWHNTR
jgi:hypothetical protein